MEERIQLRTIPTVQGGSYLSDKRPKGRPWEWWKDEVVQDGLNPTGGMRAWRRSAQGRLCWRQKLKAKNSVHFWKFLSIKPIVSKMFSSINKLFTKQLYKKQKTNMFGQLFWGVADCWFIDEIKNKKNNFNPSKCRLMT